MAKKKEPGASKITVTQRTIEYYDIDDEGDRTLSVRLTNGYLIVSDAGGGEAVFPLYIADDIITVLYDFK